MWSVGENDGMSDDFRIEHDTMGEVRVPARALWKAGRVRRRPQGVA